MKTQPDVVVTREGRHRKTLEVYKMRADGSMHPASKKTSGGRGAAVEIKNRTRALRPVQCVVRWFASKGGNGSRRTCSVFGAKWVDTVDMKVLRCASRKLFKGIQFIGVAEEAESGQHAHFVVFRIIGGSPHPLTADEETKLCHYANEWLCAWRSKPSDMASVRPSEFMRCGSSVLEGLPENAYEDILYRVPVSRQSGSSRVRRSGYGDVAIGYTVKSLLRAELASTFRGSVGIGEVERYVKGQWKVSIETPEVWDQQHSTYKFAVISVAVQEVDKQLAKGIPADEVCVYVKYGRVIVQDEGGLRVAQNDYLRIGFEILRRDLHYFSGHTLLRKATNRVCKAICMDLRVYDDDALEELAREKHREIRVSAEARQRRVADRAVTVKEKIRETYVSRTLTNGSI